LEEQQGEWNLTAQEWSVMSRCNKAAAMLYPYNSRSQENWSVRAFRKWRMEGVTPEQLRDQQSPGIKNLYSRRPPKI